MKRLSEWFELYEDVMDGNTLLADEDAECTDETGIVLASEQPSEADEGQAREELSSESDSEPPCRRASESSEFWTRAACLIANLGCAWAVTSLLAWDGFFFQRLLFSLTVEEGRLLAIAQGVGYFSGGMVAVDRVYDPMYRSLPRVVLASAAGFAVAALVLAGYLAYQLAMTTNLAYPDAWEGFLWM
ncbi:hypothetical protein [Enorma sp.]|uniref:hypothetical protein n=1 Tax=Enorma sp. TaxID=1920692 RepID=UPI0025C485E1|nr:hypothetical protein [Enorma sp.]